MTTHYWSLFSFSNMYMPYHELVFDHRQFPKGPICFDFGNGIFTEFPWIGSNLLHPVFSTPSLRALHHPSFQVVTISSQVMIQIVTTLPQVMIMHAGCFPSYSPEHAAQQPKDWGSISEKAETNTPRSTSRNVQKKWKCAWWKREERMCLNWFGPSYFNIRMHTKTKWYMHKYE